MNNNPNGITIALAKGRILDDTLPLLAELGIEPEESPAKTRKLILNTSVPDVKLLLVRTSDVPTYVQHRGADMGISGKDTLLEHGDVGLYEPLDLQIAKCKLMVAGFPEGIPNKRKLRVATKYVKSTHDWFAQQGRQVEVIKLYGSMELAPLVGMADLIVDLVDTGNTLKANGLVPIEHIADISSRLVVNRASMKMKHERITTMIEQIAQAVASRA